MSDSDEGEATGGAQATHGAVPGREDLGRLLDAADPAVLLELVAERFSVWEFAGARHAHERGRRGSGAVLLGDGSWACSACLTELHPGVDPGALSARALGEVHGFDNPGLGGYWLVEPMPAVYYVGPAGKKGEFEVGFGDECSEYSEYAHASCRRCKSRYTFHHDELVPGRVQIEWKRAIRARARDGAQSGEGDREA